MYKKIVEDARRKKLDGQMTMVGLHCKLQLLLADVLARKPGALIEFQQMVQYAPPEMKNKLLDQLRMANLVHEVL